MDEEEKVEGEELLLSSRCEQRVCHWREVVAGPYGVSSGLVVGLRYGGGQRWKQLVVFDLGRWHSGLEPSGSPRGRGWVTSSPSAAPSA